MIVQSIENKPPLLLPVHGVVVATGYELEEGRTCRGRSAVFAVS